MQGTTVSLAGFRLPFVSPHANGSGRKPSTLLGWPGESTKNDRRRRTRGFFRLTALRLVKIIAGLIVLGVSAVLARLRNRRGCWDS